MFTLDALAAELGIDPATLQSKPEVVAKWNGYLTEADGKYQSAAKAQREAEEKLAAAQREQSVIDENIKNFGYTEANIASLRANNAALQAALDEVKKQGFDINVPALPNPAGPAAPKPEEEFRNRVTSGFAQVGQTMDVVNRYQRVFGTAFPEDLESFTNAAASARMSVRDYAEQKFGFTAAEKKKAEDARKAEVQAGIDAGVKKWKEENPYTAGNPELARGGQSRNPYIVKPRETKDFKSFSNLPTRQKIAQSVARAAAAIQKTA